MNKEQIESTILEILKEKMKEVNMDPALLKGDFDLIGTGVMDSYEFLETIGDIESKTGIEVDFSDKDPSEFTTVSGLIETIAAR